MIKMYCLKCELKGDMIEMDKEVCATIDPNVEVTYFICGKCGYECEDVREDYNGVEE
jgi:hypothetical protein